MKNLVNKKVLLPVLAVILALSVANPGYAVGTSQWLQAWFMNIKIKVNGQEGCHGQGALYSKRDRMYLSLNGQYFQQKHRMDGTNYIVSITDKPDATLVR